MTRGSRTTRRRRSGGAGAVAAVLVCAPLLPACTPLFVPPVPDLLAPAPVWRVAGDARLDVVAAGDAGARLRLTASFAAVAAPAWVAVQWFGPVGAERASAATWVTPDDVGRPFVWWSPGDVEVVPGAWRALLSVDGRLLRQLDVEVAAP